MAERSPHQNDLSSAPDWMVVRAMAQGDTSALDELYARHGAGVLGFLVSRLSDRQLAEEVLQDVMLAAWDHAASFREESKVRTWLLAIARNRAINTQRKRRVQQVELSESFQLSSDETGPLEKVVKRSEQDMVRDAMRQLPDPYREVLTLVFYHQLTGPEAAEVMQVSEGTIKSRLHRAKEMLRRVLQSEGSF